MEKNCKGIHRHSAGQHNTLLDACWLFSVAVMGALTRATIDTKNGFAATLCTLQCAAIPLPVRVGAVFSVLCCVVEVVCWNQLDRPYCPTALLPYYPPALLPSCPTALLPSCPPALLPYCPTALLPSCPTALLPYCPTALLPYYRTLMKCPRLSCLHYYSLTFLNNPELCGAVCLMVLALFQINSLLRRLCCVVLGHYCVALGFTSSVLTVVFFFWLPPRIS
eukprot:gene2005-5080_t